MAEVVLEAVTKLYKGRVPACVDVDLRISDGDFVCILGPSGSGKSTLLKLIAGIEAVSRGRILFDGVDVTQVPPERRDVAMVFQSYALYPTMTVFENIAFPLRVRGVPRKEVERRVHETAVLLGLQGVLKRWPRELSGGERQRVAIGRAIIRKPKVFLFDEPLSNLDAHLRVQMRLELRRLHSLLRTTFIYVTHDQDDAMAMGSHIAVMNLGRIQQFGTPGEVYDAPSNQFVASFVGKTPMNFIDGELVVDGERTVVRTDCLDFPVTVRATHLPTPQVVVGIRPEHMVVGPQSDGMYCMEGALLSMEGMKPYVYASVQVGSRRIVSLVREGWEHTPVGERVSIHVNPAGLHFFSRDGGERLPIVAAQPSAGTLERSI
jgi:multiple sugar transport system ATP-binding protein